MIYMLDTNICIFLLGKKQKIYFDKLNRIEEEGHKIAISSIVLAELQFGISNSQKVEQNQSDLNVLLSMLDVLSYDDKCAYFYGELRTELQKNGNLIGGNDMFIASHAMAENAILITNNLQEFQRIYRLKIEYWENENAITFS